MAAPALAEDPQGWVKRYAGAGDPRRPPDIARAESGVGPRRLCPSTHRATPPRRRRHGRSPSTAVTITGRDDAGMSGGETLSHTIAANSALRLWEADLEHDDGFDNGTGARPGRGRGISDVAPGVWRGEPPAAVAGLSSRYRGLVMPAGEAGADVPRAACGRQSATGRPSGGGCRGSGPVRGVQAATYPARQTGRNRRAVRMATIAPP